jgi:MscS family membrane protein
MPFCFHFYDFKKGGRSMRASAKWIKCIITISRFIPRATILSLVLIMLSGNSSAQPTLKEMLKKPAEEEQVTDQPKTESKKPMIPLDELERGVPRTSIKGFFEAAKERDYEKAARYLDLRNLPKGVDKSDGPLLARQLKLVLDQTIWIDLDLLSTDPKGHSDDGLPTYRDWVSRIAIDKKEVDILLQRVPRSDGTYIWKFSSATVARIPQLYKLFGYGYLGEILPAVFFDLEFMGIPIWVWIYAVVLLVTAYFVVLTVTVIFTYFLSRTRARPSNRLRRFIARPIRFLLTVMLARFVLNLTSIPVAARALTEAGTLYTIIIVWTIIGLCGLIFERLADRFRRSDQHTAAAVLLPPLKNIAMIFVIVIALLVWLDNIGFKVTTLLAGLGVGSIALALAAQKSIENLIGAVTLYTSKPVRVGDFCKFGETLGTVEEIGLRSTRVRTLDHTLVSVPNAEFMNLPLNNFSKREKIRYHPKIRLRYETTPDQIRSILAEIRKLLTSHTKVLPDQMRVRFTGFGTYSLDLDIFAYIAVTDYAKYLEISEDLNLSIMDIVTQAGSSIAFPSQTTYLESGKGFDKELAHLGKSRMKE